MLDSLFLLVLLITPFALGESYPGASASPIWTVTATPSSTPSWSPVATPSPTPSASARPVAMPSATPQSTPTPAPTTYPIFTPSPTPRKDCFEGVDRNLTLVFATKAFGLGGGAPRIVAKRGNVAEVLEEMETKAWEVVRYWGLSFEVSSLTGRGQDAALDPNLDYEEAIAKVVNKEATFAAIPLKLIETDGTTEPLKLPSSLVYQSYTKKQGTLTIRAAVVYRADTVWGIYSALVCKYFDRAHLAWEAISTLLSLLSGLEI